MYEAKRYVRIGRKVYKKGETLPGNIPEERLAWLIKSGSVQECTGSDAVKEVFTPETAEDTAEEADLTEDIQADEPEEADEDAEAPEIDVMAGIVQEEPEAPKKPARTRTTKGKGKTK